MPTRLVFIKDPIRVHVIGGPGGRRWALRWIDPGSRKQKHESIDADSRDEALRQAGEREERLNSDRRLPFVPVISLVNSAIDLRTRERKHSQRAGRAIVYPREASEFEVQSFIYQSLLSLGIDVRGEVRSIVGIHDLVIFEDQRPIRVVEVKRRQSRDTAAQMRRYEGIDIRIDLVCGWEEADQYVNSWRREVIES